MRCCCSRLLVVFSGLMQGSLLFWTRAVGVLLILLGLVLLAAPAVTLHWRERVLHTPSVDIKARRERVVVVPRVVAVLVLGAGVVVLVLSRRRT